MKTIKILFILFIPLFATVGVIKALEYLENEANVEYVAPEVVTQVTAAVLPTVEKSNIDKAQEQLNEAKRLLDEEEKLILAEIDEREKRLEEIREVRLSFSQAPDQAE